MRRYILVGTISGILFGAMDAVINANPLAQRLLKVYQPIARTSVDPIAGLLIDLIYGFVMAARFCSCTGVCRAPQVGPGG